MIRKPIPDHGEAVFIAVSGETVIYKTKYRGMKEPSRHTDRNEVDTVFNQIVQNRPCYDYLFDFRRPFI